MNDTQAERVLLAAQHLALTVRDEGPDAVKDAAMRVLKAASGDPIAAITITAALIDIDLPTYAWWQRPTRALRPCGTPSAYARHLKHREQPCQPCKRAHSVVRKARRLASAA